MQLPGPRFFFFFFKKGYIVDWLLINNNNFPCQLIIYNNHVRLCTSCQVNVLQSYIRSAVVGPWAVKCIRCTVHLAALSPVSAQFALCDKPECYQEREYNNIKKADYPRLFSKSSWTPSCAHRKGLWPVWSFWLKFWF